jgi:hypothetical protein
MCVAGRLHRRRWDVCVAVERHAMVSSGDPKAERRDEPQPRRHLVPITHDLHRGWELHGHGRSAAQARRALDGDRLSEPANHCVAGVGVWFAAVARCRRGGVGGGELVCVERGGGLTLVCSEDP